MLNRKFFLASLAAGVLTFTATGKPLCEISDSDSHLQIDLGGVTVIRDDTIALLGHDSKIVANPKSDVRGIASTSSVGVSRWEWNAPLSSYSRTIERRADGAKITCDFSFAQNLPGKYAELCLYMPKAAMDWPSKDIPRGSFDRPLALKTLTGRLIIDPTGSTGGHWELDDLRGVKWCGKFRIRFSCPYNSKGTKATAVLSIRAVPEISPAFFPVRLGNVASRSFTDDTTHTGWTGQGHDNDLSRLPSGLLYAIGIPFQITGRAVILRSSHTPSFPLSTGPIKFPRPTCSRAIYFLHTAAWGEKFDVAVAAYKVIYTDGASAIFPLRYGREIIDWWLAQPTLDSRLAWAGMNGGGHKVGVYLMRAINPHPNKEIAGIEFSSANTNCTPILLAVTVANANVTAAQLKELDNVYAQNVEADLNTTGWHPCAIDWQGKIKPGSALDFSFLNHQPAGKFGFLKRVDGEFEFTDRPGQPVRFWGTNFAIEGPFPDKSLAPGIARTMAAQGVNLVRIHLYAARPTLLQAKDGGLNPDMLDKMFFLIAELKKNGVYIYMDLNDGMCYDQLLKRPSTYLPEERLKSASLFDPELKKATKLLAELLFATVNPYTGLAIADDSAIAMFETMNEVSMLSDWHSMLEYLQDKPVYRALLDKYWSKWLADNRLLIRPLPRNFNVDPVGRRFATAMDRAYLGEMSQYLRSLGVKAPICGTNITFANGNLIASAQLDFMGDHDYWAHPSFAGGKPGNYPIPSALARPVWTQPVGELGKCALKGYPIVHSEWNYCFPNAYRSEGIPTAAAYAAYQGWDGMIFYGATGSCDDGKWNRFRVNPGIMVHSQQTDPATWGMSQVGAAMFRRGDVAPARRVLEVVLPESAIDENLMAFRKMPFLSALGRFEISFAKDGKANWLGTLAESSRTPAELYAEVLKRLGDKESKADIIVSDTRQIRRYATPPLFFVDTPRTQSVTGRLCDLDKSGDALADLKINSRMPWGSLNAVSLDGKQLRSSSHILVVAVGNAANTGERLKGGFIVETGKAPVLIEPFKADVTLNCAAAKVFALNPLTGARIAEVKSTTDGKTLSFRLDGSHQTIYYEITGQ